MNVIFFHGEVFKLSSNHYYLPILSRILECLNTLLNRIWCWWLTFPLLNHNKTQQHFFLFSCTILVKFHNRKRHFGGLFKLTKSTHLRPFSIDPGFIGLSSLPALSSRWFSLIMCSLTWYSCDVQTTIWRFNIVSQTCLIA